MSQIFDLLIWRADEVDKNGDIFTLAGLLSMADTLLPGTKITVNFDCRTQVGHIIQSWVRDKELHVTAIFTDSDAIAMIHRRKAALRPGFSIGTSRLVDGQRIIDQVEMTYVALTPTPMPLPGDRSCRLCADSIPNDDLIEVCGHCIAERQ